MKHNNDISKSLSEKIDRYLNYNMAPDEREEFVKMIQDDPGLTQKVNEYKTIIEGIETQALKEKMDEFHQHIPDSDDIEPSSPSKPFRFHFITMAVAACIVLLLGFGGYWIFYQNSQNGLYNTYFSADPGLPTVMGSSDNFAFYDAMVKYKHGDYALALSKWEEQLKARPENDTLNYFVGVTKMALKDTKSAIPNLELIVDHPSSIFYNEAEFYLGLAYLKNDDMENALIHLKKSELKEARELVEELKDRM